MQLDLLNEKLKSGKWTDHDRRTFGGLLNCFRLTLRDIGLKSPAGRSESLDDFLDDMTYGTAAAPATATVSQAAPSPRPRREKLSQPPPVRLTRPAK
jgi:hypothetical protein